MVQRQVPADQRADLRLPTKPGIRESVQEKDGLSIRRPVERWRERIREDLNYRFARFRLRRFILGPVIGVSNLDRQSSP